MEVSVSPSGEKKQGIKLCGISNQQHMFWLLKINLKLSLVSQSSTVYTGLQYHAEKIEFVLYLNAVPVKLVSN